MKSSVLLLALVCLGGVVHGQKVFHEHFEDFINVIIAEAGDELISISEQYGEFDEFLTTLNYLQTTDLRDLIYEMESLPEFVAVVEFLERDNIDINFFIDLLNEALASISAFRLKMRHIAGRQQISGKDYNSFIKDATAAFPKDKLSALFDEKMEQEETFKSAIDGLYSDEWNEIFGALWDNEVFQKEIQTLNDNGVDVAVLFDELKAIFGQL